MSTPIVASGVNMPANRPDTISTNSASSSSKAKKSRAKRDAQKSLATKGGSRQATEAVEAAAAEVVNNDDLLSRLQIGRSERNSTERTEVIAANGPQTNGHESPPPPQSPIATAADTEPEVALVPLSTNTSPISSNTTTTTATTAKTTEETAEAANSAGAALTADSISYVIYQNELQMPDIMRLIQKDLSEPYSIYTYRYFIHNWPKLCYLAMHGDRCVGAIVCKLDVHRQIIKRGYIAMLAVDKEYRKLKIGTKLVQNAIQSMLTYQADEVVLETEITNTPALRLYENLGFVRDKRLFGYYLNGVDALRLKLWFR